MFDSSECQRIYEHVNVQAGAIGEAAVRRAGNKRWRAAVEARFQHVKQSRLASAALACEQLINQATTCLSQVPHALVAANFGAWQLHRNLPAVHLLQVTGS